MPFDSQGDKWSCQSCIRGHRSSKCAHYDRPMKRIPKAGRPLTKCSHLNGVDCNCREVWAIMVPLAPGSMVCSPEPETQPVQQQQVYHVYTEGR
ncbi:hypothetical protein VN97_g6421 [Penicillium thymicola]|uniref:Copper-fist domain-containing protein n=1 Tax=Penicillium thymicola TaxID=293382 RepID=A0AAI9TI77_PENTH|nr:hypothetical protein VN97_g6421 [Penicillium thymicola]